MRLIALLALVFGLNLSLSASAQEARFDPRGCPPVHCSESGWIYDDSSTSHATTWLHGLGRTPRLVQLMFSPDPKTQWVVPINWSWVYQNSGNPVSIEMSNREVKIQIWNGAPLHGRWDAETGQWTRYTEGYWKIVVYR